MPKRKRTDADDYSYAIKRRRRGFQHGVTEMCQDLYDTIRNYKVEEGRLLCEAFVRVPKRRNCPDYYDIVSTPIDLLKIQQKLKTDGYDDLDQMTTDVELVVGNARAYYKKTSQEHKDACQLWEVFVARKNRLLNFSPGKVKEDPDFDEDENSNSNIGNEVSRRPVDEVECVQGGVQGALGEEENHFEELFATAMTASDLDGRIYSTSLQLLPSQRRNPEYYKLIQEPLDLKMIATKIQYCKYQNLNELEHDLLLVVKNARIFYPLGSQVYKDAGVLRRVVVNKKMEIEHGRATGSKTSERIRQRRLAGGQRLSAITAALQYESEGETLEEDGDEEEDEEEEDDDDSDSDDGTDVPSERKRTSKSDSKSFKKSSRLHIKAGSTSARKIKFEKSNDSDDDDEEVSEEKLVQKKRGRKPLEERRRGRPRLVPVEVDSGMKKRMRQLYRSIFEFTDESGRPLITFFMEKPSRKDYPDYYQIIAEPIDMKTIDTNIKNDKYESEESLLSDFQLMFRNCRQYNEENSQIFLDAVTLEKILMDKVQDLITDSPKLKIIAKKSKVKASPQITQKLRTLYDTIRDYSDKGRKLSSIFTKLPSKSEYPDYYEVIKRPVDMQKILVRFNGGHYEVVEDMLSDFVQMFDNACKYNEPDSQIYKDALTLQRVALQCKMELSEDEDGSIPDVRPLVQELLTSLFTYVYNHQDEEGRCYSDSLAELSESHVDDQEPVKMITLDLIKRNLDKGRYKRLDIFQENMFEVFDTARKMSRTDSQVFEDSIELQTYFIKMRDELCKNGEVLSSPALRFNERDMQTNIENLRSEKLPKEKCDDDKDQDKVEKEQRSIQSNYDSSCSYREQTYRVGDYVYIEPREKGLDAHIIHIDKLWKDENGEQWLYGCWFYRPNETFHLTTRKFLEKEVFKSDCCNSTPMNQVIGKCYVMNVKDYFKYKPEGFQDKDIYVCESRYSAKVKAFKKIKIWGGNFNSHVRIVLRDTVLTPTRIPSMFKERVEKSKEDSMDAFDLGGRSFDKEKPNVILTSASNDDNTTFFEQYNIPSGRIKLGDCVLVRSENGRQLIARIDQMWEEKGKGAFFHGPWFVTPQEISHPPTRLFHKQEVFLSSIEDTNPLLSVTGRCYVMELDDYVRCRPTEIPEQDVYVCESRYLEAERQIRKLTKGLKKFLLTSNVTEDEIYYFKKPISTQKSEHSGGTQVATKSKVHTSSEPSPLLPKVSDAEMDDSNDCRTPSVGSNDAVTVPVQITSHRKKGIRRLVTGYILYAGEVRKSIILQHPDSSFGEISRYVGTEWRNLPGDIKNDYEEKAQKLNEETAEKQTLLESQTTTVVENMVYECHWEKCDAQFEDLHDLIEHVGGENGGHIFLKYQPVLDGNDFKCLWRNCTRIKKSMAPFQSIQRLARHFRDVHVRTCSKIVMPHERGRNFVPSTRGTGTGNRPATPVQSVGTPRFAQNIQNLGGGGSGYSYDQSYLMDKSSNFSPHSHHIIAGSKAVKCKERLGKTKRSKLKRRSSEELNAKKKNVQRGTCQFGPEAGEKDSDHIFVAVPPKPQRLLHSEAYLRYMEGLQLENKSISNWDHNLKACQENTPLFDSGRLPVHWLANGVGNHGNVVNALWALRDYMLKDSLNIAKLV